MKSIGASWVCTLISGAFWITFATGCNKEDTSPDQEKIIDVDGNIYTTVIIGTQVWMGEDLKVKSYRNGDPIRTTTLNISNESNPKYQWAYVGNEDTVKVYGRLYTWYAATDSEMFVPMAGTFLQTKSGKDLKTYLGGKEWPEAS